MYLSFLPRQKDVAESILLSLRSAGYDAKPLLGEPQDKSLVMLLLDMDTKEDELFGSNPWLQAQFEYSSLKALRLMPFLVYRSSLGSVEDQVEENLSDTMEAVISGEFKPYGFDLDSPNPLQEFASVLETYEE